MLTPLRLNIIEQGRATEWMTSFIMIGFAITLWMPGDTFAGNGYRSFRAVGITEETAALPLFLIGSMRCCALYINGNWRRTPVLRMIGAIFGAGMFLMVASLFLGPTLVFAPDPGVGLSMRHAGAAVGIASIWWGFRYLRLIRITIIRQAAKVTAGCLLCILVSYLVRTTFDYGAQPSTGISAYLVLALTDALSAYRSGADVWMARRVATL